MLLMKNGRAVEALMFLPYSQIYILDIEWAAVARYFPGLASIVIFDHLHDLDWLSAKWSGRGKLARKLRLERPQHAVQSPCAPSAATGVDRLSRTTALGLGKAG